MNITYHFDDCPFGCNEFGKILDDNQGMLVDCPHCSEKRKELIKNGEIVAELPSGKQKSMPSPYMLGLYFDESQMNEQFLKASKKKIIRIFSNQEDTIDENALERAENARYISSKFVYESMIPEAERRLMDPDSVRRQEEIMTDVYLNLSVGILPEVSYCFGISRVGKFENFVYPALIKAYMSGLTIAPFATISDYTQLTLDESKNEDKLNTYKNADVVILLVQDGPSNTNLCCALGLMQARSLRNKPTIFITTTRANVASQLLGYLSDEFSGFSLAKPIFVHYGNRENGLRGAFNLETKYNNYMNNLLGVPVQLNPDEENRIVCEENQTTGSKVVSSSSGNSVSMEDLMGSGYHTPNIGFTSRGSSINHLIR